MLIRKPCFENTGGTVSTRQLIARGVKSGNIVGRLEEGQRLVFCGGKSSCDNKKTLALDIGTVLKNKDVAEGIAKVRKAEKRAHTALILSRTHFSKPRAEMPGYDSDLEQAFLFSDLVQRRAGDCTEIVVLAQLMLQACGEDSYSVNGRVFVPGTKPVQDNHSFMIYPRDGSLILMDSSLHVESDGLRHVFSHVLPEGIPVCREISTGALYAGKVPGEGGPLGIWEIEAKMNIDGRAFNRHYGLSETPRWARLSTRE